MQIKIAPVTEKEFRDAVARKLGYKKGNISIAAEQAFKLWANSIETIDKKDKGKKNTYGKKRK